MVERVWWNEVLLVSSFAGAFFFGVINVPVYEAPKELTIILLTLPVLMIWPYMFLYKSLTALRDEDISPPLIKAWRLCETRTSRTPIEKPYGFVRRGRLTPKHIHFILYAIFTSYYATVLISIYYQTIRVKE